MATTGGTRQMNITKCRRGVACLPMASHGVSPRTRLRSTMKKDSNVCT